MSIAKHWPGSRLRHLAELRGRARRLEMKITTKNHGMRLAPMYYLELRRKADNGFIEGFFAISEMDALLSRMEAAACHK